MTEEVLETTTTPSSPQSPESEPETSVDLEFEEPDFGAITDFVENDGEKSPVEPSTEEPEKTAAEEPAPEEPAVEETPSESPTEPEPEKLAPEAEPEKPKEDPPVEPAAAAPEPESVVTPMPTREELEGMYKEHREKTLPQLETLFTLSDEEAAALDEQPSKVVPRLAANMMYDTMLSTYNAVMTALPRVVGTYMAASAQADTAQNAFFDKWPDLTGKKQEPAVSAAIQAYRAANPRAKLDDIIQNAGVMAMINLGLDPLKAPKPAAPAKKQAAPAKPAAPRGQNPTPPVAPGSEVINEFAALAELIIEDGK